MHQDNVAAALPNCPEALAVKNFQDIAVAAVA
jgi:hypothetical protein